jgi:hypothetical protein
VQEGVEAGSSVLGVKRMVYDAGSIGVGCGVHDVL